MKLCVRCEAKKPLDDFYRNGKYYRSYCKTCDHDRRSAAGWKWDVKGPRPRMSAEQRAARRRDRSRERYRNEPAFRARRLMQASTRRARGITHYPEADWILVLAADPCCYCGARSEQVDHVVPLIRGGDHTADNMTSACTSCNVTKGSRSLLSFMLAVA